MKLLATFRDGCLMDLCDCYFCYNLSGLRGVDVGSFPVIREWVKDAIRETLSEYVSPAFIAIDFASWFNSVPKCLP